VCSLSMETQTSVKDVIPDIGGELSLDESVIEGLESFWNPPQREAASAG